MKALNYYWLYALGRICLIGLKNPLNGYTMLRGYLSDVDKYEDLENFVPSFLKKNLFKRMFQILFRR